MDQEGAVSQEFIFGSKKVGTDAIVGGVIIMGIYSFFILIIIFVIGVSTISEGFSFATLCGLPFIALPFLMIRHFFRKFSTVRLYVQHAKNTLMLEAKFGPIVSRKQKILSDATHLSFHFYTIISYSEETTDVYGGGFVGSGNVIGQTTTTVADSGTHQFYTIHGFNETEGKWELDITKILEGLSKKNAMQIAECIGIEFRDEGEIVPKGLVIA
tara:strand:+ start:376 stop:1017 length:642 start_codon:yes stop_codon:yes gene_type:complete